jgi:RNA polymerase sigma-70 factor (ECF subfamily)
MSDRPSRPPPVRPSAAGFETHRRHLLAVAYRFVGSVSDAEDLVQETYLRWAATDPATVREPRAFLTRITARLSLDHLKSARVRRERYVGPWLPEPVVEAAGYATPPVADRTDDITVALMLALERLSPLERAAFVLHDAFGQTFEEVAAALDRTPATCRQLAARARRHLRHARPRYVVAPAEGERLAGAFLRAADSGDVTGLVRLLAADATLYSDSGGKVRAARRTIVGADRIARLFATLARKHGPPLATAPARINGLPGLVMTDPQGLTQTLAFEIRAGAITTVYLIRNPEKLRHLSSR